MTDPDPGREPRQLLAAPPATDTASLADEAPSKSERRKVTFKDTRTWWSLTACIAWILARDLSEVVVLNKPLPAVDKAAAHMRLSRLNNRTIIGARRELIKALEEGKLTARSDQGNIPPEYWSTSKSREWLYKDGADQIVIARAQMMKYWRGEERKLKDKEVVDWLDDRIKWAKTNGKQIDGERVMWEACKLERGGQITLKHFEELRKGRMGFWKVDAPGPGRRPGR